MSRALKSRFLPSCFAVVALISGFVFCPGRAQAQSDPPHALVADAPVVADAVAGGAGRVTLPASAFRPRSSATTYSFVGPRLANNSGSTQAFDAPLALPHGAVLTNLVIYYRDNDALDLVADLYRVPLPGRTGASLGTVSSSGASTSARSSSAALSDVVDLTTGGYYVRLNLPDGDIELNGVSIEYELTTGYYVLDGFGGVHAAGSVPSASGTPYFGFDVAKDLELTDTGFYVLDGFGSVHPGSLGAGPAPPNVAPAAPFFGFDIARDIELR